MSSSADWPPSDLIARCFVESIEPTPEYAQLRDARGRISATSEMPPIYDFDLAWRPPNER